MRITAATCESSQGHHEQVYSLLTAARLHRSDTLVWGIKQRIREPTWKHGGSDYIISCLLIWNTMIISVFLLIFTKYIPCCYMTAARKTSLHQNRVHRSDWFLQTWCVSHLRSTDQRGGTLLLFLTWGMKTHLLHSHYCYRFDRITRINANTNNT